MPALDTELTQMMVEVQREIRAALPTAVSTFAPAPLNMVAKCLGASSLGKIRTRLTCWSDDVARTVEDAAQRIVVLRGVIAVEG